MKKLKTFENFQRGFNASVKRLSTEQINIGDEFTYKLSESNYPQDLSPIKVKVVKIINELYFHGQVLMIPKDTAEYANFKVGTILQCHVENINLNN